MSFKIELFPLCVFYLTMHSPTHPSVEHFTDVKYVTFFFCQTLSLPVLLQLILSVLITAKISSQQNYLTLLRQLSWNLIQFFCCFITRNTYYKASCAYNFSSIKFPFQLLNVDAMFHMLLIFIWGSTLILIFVCFSGECKSFSSLP